MTSTMERAAGTSLVFGYASGFTMAFGAAISFAAARAGILGGLAPDDMIFARFVVAGAVMFPFLLYWGLPTLAGIGWPRGLALLATGGPLFAILQTGGYAFAPLAHGAVIAPSVVTILSTIGAGVLLGERLTRSHLIGAAMVLRGHPANRRSRCTRQSGRCNDVDWRSAVFCLQCPLGWIHAADQILARGCGTRDRSGCGAVALRLNSDLSGL